MRKIGAIVILTILGCGGVNQNQESSTSSTLKPLSLSSEFSDVYKYKP